MLHFECIRALFGAFHTLPAQLGPYICSNSVGGVGGTRGTGSPAGGLLAGCIVGTYSLLGRGALGLRLAGIVGLALSESRWGSCTGSQRLGESSWCLSLSSYRIEVGSVAGQPGPLF